MLTGRSSSGEPAPGRPHFQPRAKNVIFLFMPGGVSHMDSFDPKPKLDELDGKPAKLDSYVAGPKRKWLKSPWQFKTYGEIGSAGQRVVSARHEGRGRSHRHPVDEIGVPAARAGKRFPSHRQKLWRISEPWLVGNVWTRQREQEPSGLSPAQPRRQSARRNGEFLQRVPARSSPGYGSTRGRAARRQPGSRRRGSRSSKRRWNAVLAQDRTFSAVTAHDSAVDAAISNFEMAYRMQSLAPDVLDLSKEPEAIRKLYGLDAENPHKTSIRTAMPARAASGGSGCALRRSDASESVRQQRHLGSAQRPEARS